MVFARQGDKVVCRSLRELERVNPRQCVDVRLWVAASRPFLVEANLDGADLRGANLDGANLYGATHTRGTRWPTGFDPAAHDEILVSHD